MITSMTLQNPKASAPLIIEVGIECNTPDDKILANIRANSEGRKGWVKMEDAHSGVALLCGSGPSLADTMEEIREQSSKGATIFALNGAAKFLYEHGIKPDYQVLLDAQPQTADLVFWPATKHLFASQVDPECFRRVPDAVLWHATHGEVAPEFPEYEDDYCMVGGAVSVGNAAMVLAYVLGFRELHCFGYDSSHKDGKGHAFLQRMNDGDPCTEVSFNGKTYVSSLTMKLQADYFFERAWALQKEGCRITVHGYGLLPDRWNAPKLDERDKYRRIWEDRSYGDVSPGSRNVGFFLDKFKPTGTVIDFGCGSGKAGALIAKNSACQVILADFAENCLDREISGTLPFYTADLRHEMSIRGDYGFCCDVLEHIPPEDVDSTICNIMACVAKSFFQISTVDDKWGITIGHPLHLSVHPASWWKERFQSLGFAIDWMDESEMEAYFFITHP